jgi:hypothetical protein
VKKHVGVVGLLLVGLVGLAGVAGCTEPDTTPVPTVAAEPWACTGVPMRAIELMSGRENPEAEEAGSWGEDGVFHCYVETRDGKQILTVSYDRTLTGAVGTEETELPRMADYEGSVALDGGDTPGGGYAYPFGDGAAHAQWWSGSQWLAVTLERSAGGDRDPVADVGIMLVSMLPWAFGGERPPEP